MFNLPKAVRKRYGWRRGTLGLLEKCDQGCGSPQQHHVFPIRPCCETYIRGAVVEETIRSHLSPLIFISSISSISEKDMFSVQAFFSGAGIESPCATCTDRSVILENVCNM